MTTVRSLCVRRLRGTLAAAAVAAAAIGPQVMSLRLGAQASNPIPAENQLPGNPKSEWDVTGSGDSTIQGFATDISVNKGGVVSFKVSTTASTFSINIYRLGYYQGNGARKVATISNVPRITQPACRTDATTRIYDCGNWSVSSSWAIPTSAVSGIYIAKLIRGDNGGASHIPFIVRDDAAQADILMQTDDTTWQAYNQYGGWSLYLGSPGRAYKVSYNRPFATRGQTTGYGTSNYVFYAEYPMVRWLEMNGYNVKYWSGVDADRYGSALTGTARPKVLLTAGHDEYWSPGMRNALEAARGAGVSLALFTGNETFWKTRFEASIDGSNTPYRTLVTYKETLQNGVIDPQDPPTWTGTWRDPRFSPPGDGGNPENALTGQLFTVNRGSTAITVPGTYSQLRFWRNTGVAVLAPNQSISLGTNTLGYEWDEDVDNGSRPPGTVQLSSTVVSVSERIMDFGSTYLPDTATHHLTMYRHASGSLVFGAGTVQWAWGLDPNHDTDPDLGSSTPDLNMQQATINLLGDMGVQPATIQSGAIPATASTDVTPPVSTIASPVGGTIAAGTIVTISGTASDSGGVVGGVEVSVDGGATWRHANGTTNWSYTWVPGVPGPATIVSRAADDSGNLEQPATSVSVTIGQANCPCSLWAPSVTRPWMVDSSDASPIELGLKFQAEVGGLVTGMRFYKAATNTGTHTGHLWTGGGALLASVTFSGESASGWQQANFAGPVGIQANTTYVISYFAPNGHYSDDAYYFGKATRFQWPLRGLKNGTDGPNGLFNYAASAFPIDTWFSDNYWVDVLFTPDFVAPTVSMTAPANGANISGNAVTVSATASDNNGIAGVQFKIDGANLGAEDTASPYSISWNSTLTQNGTHTLTAVARDVAGNLTTSAPVTVSVFNVDTVPPSVSITWPPNGGIVGGSVNVAASATDNQGVAGVQFLIDGSNYGAEVTTPPYTIVWDASGLADNTSHTVAARARDTSNNLATSATTTVTVVNPTPGAPAIDTVVWTDQPSTVTTVTSPTFSTRFGNELLLAFVAADYLGGANTTVTGVTGAGLTWALVGRTNVQAGTSEIWRAFAPSPLSNVSVTATLSQATDSSLTIATFSNVEVTGTNGSGAIGATATANALTGAPSATLTTTRNNSWVFGVGNDFDSAIARVVGTNQALVHQYFPPVGDTYWVQRTLAPTPTAGTAVTINDTGPTTDRFNLFIVEVKALIAPDTTPPTVSVTAPATGATVSGTSVTVSASASDNVAVAGVQFQLDGVNLGAEDTAAPYTITWNTTLTADGSHSLTAIARDSSNNTATSAAVTVTVDNTPPTVGITAPATGTTVSGTSVTVAASASDNVAVAGVQFKIDGVNLGAEVTTAPYTTPWNSTTTPNGSHTLTAVARDSAGNTSTSPGVSVTVNNVDATPPVVSMTAPANGATLVGTVTVSATASDNVAVVGVQFLLDGAALGAEDTAAPYSLAWDSKTVPNGSHTLSATARDGAGNTTTATAVTVTVNNDTTAPAVSMTAPAAGATVSGNVTVSATASDNVGVVGVQFLLDGAALGTEVTTAPYTMTWSSATATNGAHTLAARARDAAGNQTTSAAVNVTVSNVSSTPPTIDTVVFTEQPNFVTTVTSPTFSTTSGNELLLAFVAADYLSGANTTVTGVTGAGLTWVLVGRTNVQAGTSEIWRAFAPSPLSNVSVTATLSQAVDSLLTIVTFSNVDVTGTNGSGAIGATATANALTGAPSATLTTTRNNSSVFGVGNDYDSAIARVVGTNQTLVHQYFPPVGDTYWVQRTLSATPTAGTAVTINDTGPTTDRFNLFIVEVKPLSAPDTTPPTVSVTAPATGATVSGTSVTVSASASDNVAVAGVQFQLDGVNLGAEDTAAPYTITWNTTLTADGSHSLTAIARDSSNNTATSAAVTVTVDNTAPAVGITAPATGATVSGSAVTVSANASDNVAVAGVQFKLDGANLGTEVTTAPYTTSWNTTTTPNGSHTLTAVARDSAGNTSTSPGVSVTVNNVDATPPVVSMTAPANGATLVGTVTVSATASDNVAVVGVQFLLDGAALGAEDTAAPYSLAWDSTTVPNGSHTLSATARDGAGNTTTAAAVTVTVNNDTTAPAVSMTAPATGATVSGNVTVSASASDNVGVVGVQFLLDGAALGTEVTTAPYTMTWSSATATNGAHTLAARARDAAGNQTTSAAVNVTVSNVSSTPPAIDAIKFVDRSNSSTTLVSGNFSTTAPNELLLAFIAADYKNGASTTVTGITGAGLTWVLVQRTNVQLGTAEIWRAFATTTLTNVGVTATLSQSVSGSMTVVSFSGVDTSGTNGSGAIGAVGTGNGASGAPSATLVTTRNNSWVFGVGNDWDTATARTLGPNQTTVHQYLATIGDTYWVQRTTTAVAAAGTSVTINDTAPTTDRYNSSICEIRPPQ